MLTCRKWRHLFSTAFVVALIASGAGSLGAQVTAALQGRVVDATGAALVGAAVRVQDRATGFDRIVATDDEGRYQVAAIPAGRTYRVSATAAGFRAHVVNELYFEV